MIITGVVSFIFGLCLYRLSLAQASCVGGMGMFFYYVFQQAF